MSRESIIRDSDGRSRIVRLLYALNLDKPWRVTVEPYKRGRSLEQNALYQKWAHIIAAETGHTNEEIKEWCRDEFLPPVIVEIDGKVKELRRSTAKLKVDEMSEYMTRVQAWAQTDLGIVLPADERGMGC